MFFFPFFLGVLFHQKKMRKRWVSPTYFIIFYLISVAITASDGWNSTVGWDHWAALGFSMCKIPQKSCGGCRIWSHRYQSSGDASRTVPVLLGFSTKVWNWSSRVPPWSRPGTANWDCTEKRAVFEGQLARQGPPENAGTSKQGTKFAIISDGFVKTYISLIQFGIGTVRSISISNLGGFELWQQYYFSTGETKHQPEMVQKLAAPRFVAIRLFVRHAGPSVPIEQFSSRLQTGAFRTVVKPDGQIKTKCSLL